MLKCIEMHFQWQDSLNRDKHQPEDTLIKHSGQSNKTGRIGEVALTRETTVRSKSKERKERELMTNKIYNMRKRTKINLHL